MKKFYRVAAIFDDCSCWKQFLSLFLSFVTMVEALSNNWKDGWERNQLENSGFRSKRHMKLILRWMRENRRVRKECNSIGEHPDEKQFVFSVEPPKIERKNPSTPPEHTTTATTVSSK